MATIIKFEESEVWQEARKFTQAIFEAYINSESFSKDYKLDFKGRKFKRETIANSKS
jgi:hypothetical protein